MAATDNPTQRNWKHHKETNVTILIALAAFICGFILGGASVLSIASVWPSYPGDGLDKGG